MRRLAIALVFLGGCAVGGAASQVAVPKARAANVQRWQHFCMMTGPGADEANKKMRKPGEEGFELAGVSVTPYHEMMACFKRPADG